MYLPQSLSANDVADFIANHFPEVSAPGILPRVLIDLQWEHRATYGADLFSDSIGRNEAGCPCIPTLSGERMYSHRAFPLPLIAQLFLLSTLMPEEVAA